MLFYPRGYWHQTENLDDENIAVSSTTVSVNTADAMKVAVSGFVNVH
jgi:hypothetical protein